MMITRVFVYYILIYLFCGAVLGSVLSRGILWGHQDPLAAAVRFNDRGTRYFQKDQIDLAEADFRRAMAIAFSQGGMKGGKVVLPRKAAVEYALASNDIGRILALRNNHAGALDYFDRAIAVDPKASYFNNRAIALVKMQRKDAALVAYDLALKSDASFYQAWVNRGLLYYKNGDKVLALADFKRAIKVNPIAEEGYMQAGRVYFEYHQLEDAARMFEAVIKMNPDNAQALYNLGVVVAGLGNQEKSRALLEQARIKGAEALKKYSLPD